MTLGCVFWPTASSCTDAVDAHTAYLGEGRLQDWDAGGSHIILGQIQRPFKSVQSPSLAWASLTRPRDTCFRSWITNWDVSRHRDGKATDSGCALQKAADRYFTRQLLKGRLNFSKIRRAPASWNASRPPPSSSYDNSCCVGNLTLMKELKAGWWAISVTHLWIEHTPGVRLRTGVTQWIEATPREFFLE